MFVSQGPRCHDARRRTPPRRSPAGLGPPAGAPRAADARDRDQGLELWWVSHRVSFRGTSLRVAAFYGKDAACITFGPCRWAHSRLKVREMSYAMMEGACRIRVHCRRFVRLQWRTWSNRGPDMRPCSTNRLLQRDFSMLATFRSSGSKAHDGKPRTVCVQSKRRSSESFAEAVSLSVSVQLTSLHTPIHTQRVSAQNHMLGCASTHTARSTHGHSHATPQSMVVWSSSIARHQPEHDVPPSRRAPFACACLHLRTLLPSSAEALDERPDAAEKGGRLPRTRGRRRRRLCIALA